MQTELPDLLHMGVIHIRNMVHWEGMSIDHLHVVLSMGYVCCFLIQGRIMLDTIVVQI